jgi:hypothetical protein
VLGMARSLPACDDIRCLVLYESETARRLTRLGANPWAEALAVLAVAANPEGAQSWYILPCDGQRLTSSAYGRTKGESAQERLGLALVALVPGATAHDSALISRPHAATPAWTPKSDLQRVWRVRRKATALRVCEHGAGNLRVAVRLRGGKIKHARATPCVPAHGRLFMTFGAGSDTEYDLGATWVLQEYVDATARQRDLWASFCAPGLKTFKQRFAVRALLEESGVWDAPPAQQEVIAAIGPDKRHDVPLGLAYLRDLLAVTEVAAS